MATVTTHSTYRIIDMTVLNLTMYRRYKAFMEQESIHGMFSNSLSFADFCKVAEKVSMPIPDGIWCKSDFVREYTELSQILSKSKLSKRTLLAVEKRGKVLREAAFKFFRTTYLIEDIVLSVKYHIFGEYCIARKSGYKDSFSEFLLDYIEEEESILSVWTEDFVVNHSHLNKVGKADAKIQKSYLNKRLWA